MKALLKNAREQKGLKTREVSKLLSIDQALISKFESGQRQPTKKQILELAQLLEIDFETLMVAWLKEKILNQISGEEYGFKALAEVHRELQPQITKDSIDDLFSEMDLLKSKMEAFRNRQNP
ncbi:helix-turn-helix transcriptional regulator [Flavobacterium sp.]|uniref:helix-turn-helix domain-containing protein n=1 Tax=Flavobacterium sp. TaxID=239 RepID=UPI00260B2162|nr:helix-turn-helix transcriptional regulator [Flavobacterium sp.]